MQPTNADLQHSFEEHARHDESVLEKPRKTAESVLELLHELRDKLDPEHEHYINKGIEERLTGIETSMQPILELYQGLTFGGKTLRYTSGIVLAITIIAGSIIGIVKYLKG